MLLFSRRVILRRSEFVKRLLLRVTELAEEFDQDTFVVPVALVLVLDAEHGGNITAQELMKRIHLLDLESRNFIDFYFLGWEESDNDLTFSIKEFVSFVEMLTPHGIVFGGDADLVLLDAVFTQESASLILDFSKAIHLNLAALISEDKFPTLGKLLQDIVFAAKELRTTYAESTGSTVSPVAAISDALGLAIAKESFGEWFLEKLGKIIGASRLNAVATRNLGRPVSIYEFDVRRTRIPSSALTRRGPVAEDVATPTPDEPRDILSTPACETAVTPPGA